MGFEIRAARPEDARFLAWAVVESGRSHLPRGFWDLLVAESDAARIDFVTRLVLAEPASWWHWTIFHIAELDGAPAATRPAARGHGLAQALVAHVQDEGRRRGLRQAELTLMIGNTAAQRVYERAGFAITAEKRDAAFEAALGCPGLAKMSCQL